MCMILSDSAREMSNNLINQSRFNESGRKQKSMHCMTLEKHIYKYFAEANQAMN